MNGAQVGAAQHPTIAQRPATSEVGTAGQNNGTRAGQFVNATNPPSPMSQALDAAEEVTMGAHRLKKPGEFKISKGKSGAERQLELIRKIKSVQNIQNVDDFKRKFPDQPNPDLKSDDYLKQAGESFSDPFHRYVALHELALDYGAQQDDEIYQAIDALEEKFPQCIGLGNQISDAVGLIEEWRPEYSVDQIKQDFFGEVKDYKSLRSAFNGLQDTKDAASFTKSVDMELKRLGGQLNCMTVTTEDTHLRAVVNDMTALKRVVGMHDNCMETQEQILRPPQNMKQFDGHRYMGEVLKIIDKQFVVHSDFINLLGEMGTEDISQKLFLANKTGCLFRELPEEIFGNDHIKPGMVQTLQEVQDELALEEEGLKSEGSNYGQIGEQEVSLDQFVHSGDILGDLGVNLTGRSEPQGAPDQSQSEPTQAPPDQSEPVTSSGEPVTVSATGSLDGLDDKQLMSKQDELLQQARALQQRKDQNYVSTSSITALSHALNDESDVLTALQNIAQQRGRGFAKGLNIAITPAGGDKALQLMPPDKKALQAWAAQEGNNLDELVRTAMSVLENDRDSGFDPEKVGMEFANLKDAITQIDNRIKNKPLLRDRGESVFDRLEYAHKFTVQADQGAVSVEAEVPKEKTASPENGQAKKGTANGSPGLPGIGGIPVQNSDEDGTQRRIS